MKKIYIVKSYSWNDEDTIVGIYNNESSAITVAKRERDKHVNWEKNLPIPLEIYELYHDTVVNDISDMVTEEFEYDEDDIDFVPFEFYYTNEEWDKTTEMIDFYENSDYDCTKVFEVILFEDEKSTYPPNINNDDSEQIPNMDDNLKCVFET